MACFDGRTSCGDSNENAIQSTVEKSLHDHSKSLDVKSDDYLHFSAGCHSTKLPEFISEDFSSYSSVHSRRTDSSPYSLRQSQLSIPYQYDMLLLYDPDDDICYLNDLLEFLVPQQLKIFDFNRDAPAGMPPQKVLQSTFKMCRYTCIMITQKFISNFWLQFRADMTIQDMLDNQEKLYSVIVVVMDKSVKKYDLPLDLITLSPLFITDRYFKDRIKKAFSKDMPFPPSVYTSSNFSKQPLPISHLPPSYNDISIADPFPNCNIERKGKVDRNLLQDGNFTNLASAQYKVTDVKRIESTTASEDPLTFSLGPSSRLPREHSDYTYLMPPSLFPSTSLESPSCAMPLAHTIQRGSSVIVNSTGSREPQEVPETGISGKGSLSTKSHSTLSSQGTGACNPSTSSSEGSRSVETADSSQARHQYLEEDFSFLNSTEGTGREEGVGNSQREYESPAFFSINTTDSVRSGYSDYSDLEISQLSEAQPATMRERDCVHSQGDSAQAVAVSKHSVVADSHLRDDVSYLSLPDPRLQTLVNEPPIARCNSLGQDQVPTRKKLSHLVNGDGEACVSLPDHSAEKISNTNVPKRSFSVRSLFGLRKTKNKTSRAKKN